jgi:hypothetical protein
VVRALVVLATASLAPLTTLPSPIVESSGVASSSTSDAWFFTHEDSGSDAQFHAVGVDGVLLATYVLPDVQARDWEDMARGPDEQGRSSLWLGDIGDNNARRDLGLLVHRVPEPQPDLQRADVEVTTEPPVSFRLRYEDGPGDAETLLVHPRTGRLYVVNKPLGGSAGLYAAPEVLDPAGPNALTRVADVNGVGSTGTPGGPAIGGVAQLLVTGGDIAPRRPPGGAAHLHRPLRVAGRGRRRRGGAAGRAGGHRAAVDLPGGGRRLHPGRHGAAADHRGRAGAGAPRPGCRSRRRPPGGGGPGTGPGAEEPGGRVRTVVLAGGGVLALLVLAAAVRSRRRRPR